AHAEEEQRVGLFLLGAPELLHHRSVGAGGFLGGIAFDRGARHGGAECKYRGRTFALPRAIPVASCIERARYGACAPAWIPAEFPTESRLKRPARGFTRSRSSSPASPPSVARTTRTARNARFVTSKGDSWRPHRRPTRSPRRPARSF